MPAGQGAKHATESVVDAARRRQAAAKPPEGGVIMSGDLSRANRRTLPPGPYNPGEMKPANGLLRTRAPAAVLLIRLLAGAVFFAEGVKKFLFAAQWGAGRFERIGIPWPHVLGPFVGTAEIVCGLLLLVGLLSRPAALVLLVNICVAIATTKVPILRDRGFWAMEDAARTDYSMLLSTLFLLIVGAGAWSLDAWIASAAPPGGAPALRREAPTGGCWPSFAPRAP